MAYEVNKVPTEQLVQHILNSPLRDKIVVSTCAIKHNWIDKFDLVTLNIEHLSQLKQIEIMQALRKQYSIEYWYERLLCQVYGIKVSEQLVSLIGSYVLNAEQRIGLEYVLSKLTDRQKDVITCRVKFDKTLDETATYLGLPSKETPRQVQSKVFRIIRNPVNAVYYKLGYTAAIQAKERRTQITRQNAQAQLRVSKITSNSLISDIPFSLRTSNALRRNSITTVGQIKSVKQLLGMKGLGATSVNEITTILATAGIKLN